MFKAIYKDVSNGTDTISFSNINVDAGDFIAVMLVSRLTVGATVPLNTIGWTTHRVTTGDTQTFVDHNVYYKQASDVDKNLTITLSTAQNFGAIVFVSSAAVDLNDIFILENASTGISTAPTVLQDSPDTRASRIFLKMAAAGDDGATLTSDASNEKDGTESFIAGTSLDVSVSGIMDYYHATDDKRSGSTFQSSDTEAMTYVMMILPYDQLNTGTTAGNITLPSTMNIDQGFDISFAGFTNDISTGTTVRIDGLALTHTVTGTTDGTISVAPMNFAPLLEHHKMPHLGTVTVEVLDGGSVVGLIGDLTHSTLTSSRLLDAFDESGFQDFQPTRAPDVGDLIVYPMSKVSISPYGVWTFDQPQADVDVWVVKPNKDVFHTNVVIDVVTLTLPFGVVSGGIGIEYNKPFTITVENTPTNVVGARVVITEVLPQGTTRQPVSLQTNATFNSANNTVTGQFDLPLSGDVIASGTVDVRVELLN